MSEYHRSENTVNKFFDIEGNSFEEWKKEFGDKADHSWQYELRKRNYKRDLIFSGLTEEEVQELSVDDFDFEFVPSDDKLECRKVKKFIKRHEWLGTMPHNPSHRFVAKYKGILSGAVILSTPNAQNYLLGKEYKDKERLIARGSCISWSPKNLASSLIMWSLQWMTKNTKYRYFTAYADPKANELGTIYQACNFYYLGQNYGVTKKYFDPERPEAGWTNDRVFRQDTAYRRYARKLGLPWKDGWTDDMSVNWNKIPNEIEQKLREEGKRRQQNAIVKKRPKKHKYVYVLGEDSRETRKLNRRFKRLNPKAARRPYPKDRGVSKSTEKAVNKFFTID